MLRGDAGVEGVKRERTSGEDCRHLSVFRQATLSRTLGCHGTAKEWNARSERPLWDGGVDKLVSFSRSARQSERTLELGVDARLDQLMGGD